MTTRAISASAAPYDGYDRDTMLQSIARIGFTHVEPAFIVGYTEPFTEDLFTPAHAREWEHSISAVGLKCHAMSSHIDLSAEGAAQIFLRRMDFVAAMGAKVIISNAGPAARKGMFLRNIQALLPHATALNLSIALENPGDGSDSIINLAVEGLALVDEIGSDWVGLNYDAANTASHRPSMADLAQDAIAALPKSIYAHIKDVRRSAAGWHFTPIGDGDVGCAALLSALRGYPELPISIELPLRLHRDATAKPVRSPDKVGLGQIEDALGRSLRTVRAALGG